MEAERPIALRAYIANKTEPHNNTPIGEVRFTLSVKNISPDAKLSQWVEST